MPHYKWTIFLMVQSLEDNHNSSYYEMLKGQLMQVQKTDDVKIAVLVSKNWGRNQERKPSVRLYDILYDEAAKKYNDKCIRDFGEIQLDKKESLVQIFMEVKNSFTADNYMMLIWGHGIGFGFFDGTLDQASFDDVDFSGNKLLENLKKYYGVLADNVNVLLPQGLEPGQTKLLTPEHLATAIEATFGTVELIVTMCCCMQSLMTAYALKDVCKCIVGGETLMPYIGYNYKEVSNWLIDKLKNDETVDIEDFARKWVTTLDSRYDTEEKKQAYAPINVSAIKVSPINDLFLSLETLYKEIVKNQQTNLDYFIQGRDSCNDVSNTTPDDGPMNYFMIDLKAWLQKIDGMKDNLGIGDLAGKCIAVLDTIILENKPGPALTGANTCNGLSFYFPKTLFEYYTDYYYSVVKKGSEFDCDYFSNSVWANVFERMLVLRALKELP